MSLTLIVDKELVPGEEDFAHDITILTKVSSDRFYTEVVETKEQGITVILYGLIADMVKSKYNVPAGDDLIGSLVGDNVLQ